MFFFKRLYIFVFMNIKRNVKSMGDLFVFSSEICDKVHANFTTVNQLINTPTNK